MSVESLPSMNEPASRPTLLPKIVVSLLLLAWSATYIGAASSLDANINAATTKMISMKLSVSLEQPTIALKVRITN
jgi:hypothetical protein